VRWLSLLLLAGCDRVFLAGRAATDAQPDMGLGCPGSYETVATLPSRYRIIEDMGELAIQRARCRADDPRRTHLAVLETANEMGDVRVWIDGREHVDNDFLWVGAVQSASATARDAGWQWVTGLPVASELWIAGEPNDSDNNEDHLEDAAAVRRNNGIGLTDLPEAYMLRAVCECDGIEAP
jgi:hypothetical protein